MITLAWYYSEKLKVNRDLNKIDIRDLDDFDNYWHRVGFNFVDGSRLTFDTVTRQSYIIDVHLDDEEKELAKKLTRSKTA